MSPPSGFKLVAGGWTIPAATLPLLAVDLAKAYRRGEAARAKACNGTRDRALTQAEQDELFRLAAEQRPRTPRSPF